MLLTFVREAYSMNSLGITLLIASTMLHYQLPTGADVRQQESVVEEKADNSLIIADFKKAYAKVNSPKITIIWNKKFDNQFSDWESQPLKMKHSEKITLESDDDKIEGSYESATSALSRKRQFSRYAPKERDIERFKTQFIDAMLIANVNLVDKSVIERLTALKSDTSASLLDSKEVETEALLNYSDYLIELLFIPTDEHYLGFDASVEIKEVNTGKLIARLLSEPPEQVQTQSYIATESGFKLTFDELERADFGELADELALGTLVRLTRALK